MTEQTHQRISFTLSRVVVALAIAGALFNVVSWALGSGVTSADATTTTTTAPAQQPSTGCFEDEAYVVMPGSDQRECVPIDELAGETVTRFIEQCINATVNYGGDNEYWRAELVVHRDSATGTAWKCRADVDAQYGNAGLTEPHATPDSATR